MRAELSAFGNYSDRVRFAAIVGVAQKIDHDLWLRWEFGHDDRLGAAGDSSCQCQVTTFAAHDFDQKSSMMGTGSDLNPINCFEGNIECCIDTDRYIGPAEIVVDSRRDPYHRKTGGRQSGDSGLRSVSTDYDEPLDSRLLQIILTFSNASLRFEVGTTGTAKDGAALLNNSADIARGKHAEVCI